MKGVVAVQITVSARHGHLSEDAQGLVTEKMEKLLHFFDRLTMIEVTVDLQKEVREVELRVQAEHKHDMVAKAEDRELMHAVDQALSKMEGQLRRYKDKIQDHRRAPSTGQVSSGPELEQSTEE